MPPAGRAEGLRATRPSRFAGGRHHFHVSAFGVANSAAKVELTWKRLGLLRVLRDRLAAIDDIEAFGQLEELGVGFGEVDIGERENLLAD